MFMCLASNPTANQIATIAIFKDRFFYTTVWINHETLLLGSVNIDYATAFIMISISLSNPGLDATNLTFSFLRKSKYSSGEDGMAPNS